MLPRRASEAKSDLLEAKRDLPAPAYLLGASALWATYPSTIKCLFAAPGSAISPGEATLLRFVVMAVATSSALSAAPVDDAAPAPLADQLERRVPSSVYVAALELGALGLAGTLCNTAGLARIPALTGAVVLTSLNVWTPLIAACAGATAAERAVDATTWALCAVALVASAYALVPDASANVFEVPAFGAGELGCLAASFFFAAAKVRLSSHLKIHDADALTSGRVVAQCGLAAAGLGLADETNALHELLPSERGGLGVGLPAVLGESEAWLAGLSGPQLFWVAASALLSGAGALFCQSRGQARVPAPTAQLYFSTQPIFVALWAFALLREPVTRHEVAGGAALLVGLAAARRGAQVNG